MERHPERSPLRGWALPALAVCVFGALPAVAQPHTVRFSHGVGVGATASVDRKVVVEVDLQARGDGLVATRIGRTSTMHETYVQTVLAISPSGEPLRVRRQYGVATVTIHPDDGNTTTSSRSVQHRTFTIEATTGDPKITSAKRVTTEERMLLRMALRDDLGHLLPTGAKAIGDSWAVPQSCLRGFFYTSSGTGTCRLDSIVEHGGHQCARIDVSARVIATEIHGVRYEMELSGTLLWDLKAKQLVRVSLEAPMKITATSARGADVTEAHGTGRLRIETTTLWSEPSSEMPTRAPGG